MTVSRFNPNPKRARLVALIPTRRVSEGFCGIVRPSLTRRAGMFPLPAANQLNQQAVTLRVVKSRLRSKDPLNQQAS